MATSITKFSNDDRKYLPLVVVVVVVVVGVLLLSMRIYQ
jgi:hypothetical protein